VRWTHSHGTFWTRDLTRAGPCLPATRPDVVFVEARCESAATLARAIGLASAEPIEERFRAGRRCFVARVGEDLAAYAWVSQGAEDIGELERVITLQPGEAYVWDCATLPPFRRQHLYCRLLAHIAERLAAEGRVRLWIGADAGNLASIRGFARAGFEPAIRVAYLRIGKLRGTWMRGERRASPAVEAAARRAMMQWGGERLFGRLALSIG
jgi:ribosomal protein S18 acetylase RimI-like enzyme